MPSLRLSPGFPSPSIRRRHVILTVLVCLTAYTLLVSSPTVPDNWREMLKLPDHRAASYEDINDDKLRIRRTGQRPHRPRSPPLHPSETLVVLQERIRDLSEGSAEVLDQLERDMKLEMRIWPEACGDFGERQIAAHDRYNFAPDTTPVIVSHVRNYWVDNSPPGGFADRVKGLITAFALAIALEMPFFLNWDEDVTLPPELVLESPYINWIWSSPLPNPRDPNQAWLRFYQPRSEFSIWDWSREDAMARTATAPMNVWAGNIGVISGILESDTWIGKELRRQGLTPYNAYGCISHFLFRPLGTTRKALLPYQAILRHPEVFSVAIQIRWVNIPSSADQDAVFNVQDEDPLLYDTLGTHHVFSCAVDLTLARLQPHHKLVVFYLTADDNNLRRLAATDLSRLLPVEWPEHRIPRPLPLIASDHAAHVSKVLDPTPEADQAAFQSTILDNYIMDAANARIISFNSGYGVLSALRSWEQTAHNSTFMVYQPTRGRSRQSPTTTDGRSCSAPDAHLSYGVLSRQYGFS